MSKNDQTVTARVKNKWYCWSITAESCDDESEVVLSIDDPLVGVGSTKRQAIKKIEDVFDVSEYGNYDAENGYSYLAKDGKPVRIYELTTPTGSKKEQVDKKEYDKLEVKVDRMADVMSSLAVSRQTLQHAFEELGQHCAEIAHLCEDFARLIEFQRMSYDVDKKKALTEFFELDKKKK